MPRTTPKTKPDQSSCPRYILNERGLTVAELKAFVAQVPDVQENGEPNTVWISVERGYTNTAVRVTALNWRPDRRGCDILIATRTGD